MNPKISRIIRYDIVTLQLAAVLVGGFMIALGLALWSWRPLGWTLALWTFAWWLAPNLIRVVNTLERKK